MQTLIAETKAQGAGFAEPRFAATMRLAGLSLEGQPITVAKLDARFWGLPTPVAGVIGMDLLKGYVLDVRFAPCRIGLWRAGEAPPFAGGHVAPLSLAGGLPAVEA